MRDPDHGGGSGGGERRDRLTALSEAVVSLGGLIAKLGEASGERDAYVRELARGFIDVSDCIVELRHAVDRLEIRVEKLEAPTPGEGDR
jgi:hypothetical protein